MKSIWDVLDEDGHVDVLVTRDDGSKFVYRIQRPEPETE